MTLTDGMDVARMRQIAEQLVLQSKQLTGVAQDGSASMSRLVEAWQGPDTEFFSQGWTQAGRQCDETAETLRSFGERMRAQADQQNEASGNRRGGGGGGGGPRGPGGDGDGVSSSNPDITDDTKDAEYKDVDGPLIDEGGVEPDDVKQGALGDCWLISSMKGIAGTPSGQELIEKNIKDNGDGTYDVTLYRDGEPVVVTVDGKLPVGPNGEPVYANNDGGGREMWPLLYEKAMAKEFGGDYEDLDGDWPAKAIEAMTGNEVETYDEGLMPWDDKDFPGASDLQAKLDDGGVIVASTDGDGKKHSDGDLVSNHAYTVTDVNPETGEVTVQNPWGKGEAPITMSYEEFEKNFARLDVGSTK